MDEIELFTALRPASGTEMSGQRERARARLAGAMSESGARAGARSPGRRLGGLNPPARKAFTVGGAALAVGGATVLAGVLPAVLSSGPSGALITSAWAVQPRKDGTVKVTIKDATDPAGLQRALRAAGIRAIVVSPRENSFKGAQGGWVTEPVCSYPTTGRLFSPVAVQRAVVTLPKPASGSGQSPRVIAYIHPAAMPKGSVLFISDSFSVLSNGDRVLSVTSPAVLKSDKLPGCRRNAYPAPVPVPSGSPSPVPSATPSTTGGPSPVPSARPSRSQSPSSSPSPTPTRTRSPSSSPSPTPTRTRSPSSSPSPTPTRSHSPSPAPTRSTTPVPTPSE